MSRLDIGPTGAGPWLWCSTARARAHSRRSRPSSSSPKKRASSSSPPARVTGRGMPSAGLTALMSARSTLSSQRSSTATRSTPSASRSAASRTVPHALSLGLANGDLFTHVLAFSPGFIPPAGRRGRPAVYIAHGLSDPVLPIGRTSRRIVPSLRGGGYPVDYREFDGGHSIPPEVAKQALEWFAGSGAR